MPDCPECVAREKKKIIEKYEAETPEENRNREDQFKLFENIEIPMKMDPRTKHFICQKISNLQIWNEGLFMSSQ